MLKCCSKCKTEKPLTEFYKNRSTGDGFTYYCKVCSNVDFGKFREANRDRLNERARKAASLRTKEKIDSDKKRARENNKEKLYSAKRWEIIKATPILLDKKRMADRDYRKRKFTPTLLPRKPRRDKDPIEVFIKKRKEYSKKHAETLPDSVIKNRLVHRTNIDRKSIPPELIEAKRIHIQIVKKLKELKA